MILEILKMSNMSFDGRVINFICRQETATYFD